MLHTFENGFCTTCGESFDYMMDNDYNGINQRSIIGPLLPINDNQGTFQFTVTVMA